jgi:hypothetical protein
MALAKMIRNDTYPIAELKSRRQDGELHQSRVTNQACLSTFDDLYQQVRSLTYPTQQETKYHTYGWTPTIFDVSANRQGDEGLWRVGDAAADEVACFYADVDNNDPTRPMVRMEDVEAALQDLELAHFLYPSYSHDEDAKHKFRVVVDTDRAITWEESFRIFGVLNDRIFGRQGDYSIYDRGDHLYAPTSRWRIGALSPGNHLVVDSLLATWDALPADYRLSLRRTAAGTAPRSRGPTRALTPQEAERYQKLRLSARIRPFITLKNPRIWNPAWDGDYAAKTSGGSHWQTMRALLGRVWMKSGGNLTSAEMEKLFREIDATDNNYFQATYDDAKLNELLDFIMSQPAGEASPEEREPAPAQEGETMVGTGAGIPISVEPRNAPEELLTDRLIPDYHHVTKWLRDAYPAEKILKSLAKLRDKEPQNYGDVLAQLLALKADPMIKDALDAHFAA